MSAVSTEATDRRLAELHGQLAILEAEGEPLTLAIAVTYIRAAYGRGYCDALTDEENFLIAAPMCAYPMLFLPVIQEAP